LKKIHVAQRPRRSGQAVRAKQAERQFLEESGEGFPLTASPRTERPRPFGGDRNDLTLRKHRTIKETPAIEFTGKLWAKHNALEETS